MTEEQRLQLAGVDVTLRPMQPTDAVALGALPAPAEHTGEDCSPDRTAPRRRVTRLSIVAGDEIAGVIEFRPADPNAPVRLHLDAGPPPLSTEVLAALIRYLVDERGYHRVVARSAADDATAIQIYEDAGFRRVGVLRQARRDDAGEWRDALLMEWVDVR